MKDVFTQYETGLTRLLERLGKGHPRYAEALTLQSRLLENIAQARRYGDAETRRAERAQIVDALNRLALETVEVSLGDLSDEEITSPFESPKPVFEKSKWNTAAIRDLLIAALNDEELTTLCFDYFRPVYENLAAGMGKGQKIQRLLDYCERHNRIPKLLDRVRQVNPSKYTEFESKLVQRSEPEPPAPPALTPLPGLQTEDDSDAEPMSGHVVPLRPLLILVNVIAATILGLVSNTLAPILLPVNTPQRLLIALGVSCLTLATMLWTEFRQTRVPITSWSLWVTRLLAGAGILFLAGGIVWGGIIAMPSAIETSTPTPTPTPDCSGVQVAYLELDLLSDTKKYYVEHGEIAREIVLELSEIDGLQYLSGRAELSPTVPEGCTCDWEGRTSVIAPWESITSSIDRCSFSITLPTQVQSVALSLTIGEQPPPKIFIIRVPR